MITGLNCSWVRTWLISMTLILKRNYKLWRKRKTVFWLKKEKRLKWRRVLMKMASLLRV
jgi:hypothetical protein